MLLTNPKDTTQTIDSKFTDVEAVKVLEQLKTEFAISLRSRFPNVSAAQRFWIHKLAMEHAFPVFHQLHSNLEEFCRKFRILQFRMDLIKKEGMEELISLGKVKILNGDKCLVWSGERVVGRIGEDKFYPANRCPAILTAQIEVFSYAPVEFMELFGRATGVCCVCGRLLTNEGSVARGIGPICAEEHGL